MLFEEVKLINDQLQICTVYKRSFSCTTFNVKLFNSFHSYNRNSSTITKTSLYFKIRVKGPFRRLSSNSYDGKKLKHATHSI